MNELVVFAKDYTNKELLSAMVIISATVIIIVLFVYLKRRKAGR